MSSYDERPVVFDCHGTELIGIVATPLALVVPNYLRRYRPGGQREAVARTAICLICF